MVAGRLFNRTHWRYRNREDTVSTNYVDRLRRLALNDPSLVSEELGVPVRASRLDSKTLALVRLGALISVGGSEPSFAELTDAAISAGATADEIVEVLTSVGGIVGVPRIVTAAPNLLALGIDVNSFAD
ncbi:carboxymuconolactone decarboxylase family protein [Microbacterium sp.]|uniref:carboxymuconolactone decarboxylase family protein n=1 Tax=Microbacterium sp. TaxID=51671 RepID=UPI002E340268|nr:carboxymuconolactone decarboxylase family protein [Microbacterium sp.]HEX5728317.1 carboxymuconolactone decarboxylase family protein [Microbacterium sp.]